MVLDEKLGLCGSHDAVLILYPSKGAETEAQSVIDLKSVAGGDSLSDEFDDCGAMRGLLPLFLNQIEVLVHGLQRSGQLLRIGIVAKIVKGRESVCVA